MIKTSLGDITDEEFDNILKSHSDNLNHYIEKYVLPEVVAFSIASGFERNALWQSTLTQQYNSIKDSVLIYNKNKDQVLKDIKQILEIKYSLLITNDNPLEIKK